MKKVYLFILVFAIAALIRVFVIDIRTIPTSSMSPAIKPGDRVVGERLFWKITGLNRGEIIVFHSPAHSNHFKTNDMIKRVIALSGDTIELKNSVLIVNGNIVEETYIIDKNINNFGPYTVPEGYVFVMGDNRKESSDSRSWGPLPLKSVVSVVFGK